MLPRFASKQKRGAGFSSPMFVYRWEMMRELLDRHRDDDGDAHDGLMVEYIDPTTGQPVFKTITFFVQMLQPGQKHVAGEDDLEPAGLAVRRARAFDRRRSEASSGIEFDTLAVPGGSWFEHINTSSKEPLFLFVASDEPTLKKLALYKKWGKSASGEVSQIFD